MKRRDFIKAAASLPIVAAVPAVMAKQAEPIARCGLAQTFPRYTPGKGHMIIRPGIWDAPSSLYLGNSPMNFAVMSEGGGMTTVWRAQHKVRL